MEGGEMGTSTEEEILCLSSVSETGGSGPESGDEALQGSGKWLAGLLGPLMDLEGSSRRRAKWRETLRSLEDTIGRREDKVRREGYSEAVSTNKKQLEDVEELLEKERMERGKLEKEKRDFDWEVRGMVREEMEMVLGKKPRDGEVERKLEWIKRDAEMIKELKTMIDAWAEGKEYAYRLELNMELDKVMRKRNEWLKKEIDEWSVDAEVRYRVEKERERVERERDEVERGKEKKRERGIGERIRKELEEILERREIGIRGMVREKIKKALEERSESVEGGRDIGEQGQGQGRQERDKEKDSGTGEVRRRKAETVRVRAESFPFFLLPSHQNRTCQQGQAGTKACPTGGAIILSTGRNEGFPPPAVQRGEEVRGSCRRYPEWRLRCRHCTQLPTLTVRGVVATTHRSRGHH